MAYGILVIEDEVTLGKNVQKYLQKHHYDVRLAHDGREGLKQFGEFNPDAVVLDYQLPGADGLEVLREIHQLDPQVKVIMVTAHGSVEIAIEAIKSGAHDYLNKPLVLSELKLVIDKAVGQDRLEGALSYFQARQASKGGLDALLGQSSKMSDLRQHIRRLLSAEAALQGTPPPAALITGETGTGKELVARALHFDGVRQAGPFVELNCSTLPEHLIEAELFGHERGAFTDAKSRKLGLIESANGGTLFLDEVGDLSPGAQVKLLKVLEDQTVRRIGSVRDHNVNVRIVAATNRALEHMVEQDRFRADLYFRLCTTTLSLPPLRERTEDLRLLADHFLTFHAARYGRKMMKLTDGAHAAMRVHHWPGNVRELRNVIEQAVMVTPDDHIDAAHLSLASGLRSHGSSNTDAEDLRRLPPDGVDLEQLEKDLVLQALERTSWNVTQAAQLLGLTRDTLRYRVEKYALKGLAKKQGE